jgi:hypothetical protein
MHNWIVHVKGGPNKVPFEIAVIQRDNEHGLKSYGWYGPTKLLISHNGGPCPWPVTQQVWDKLVKIAYEVAEELSNAS